MLKNVNMTVEVAAEQSGLNDPRHFRRAWKGEAGVPPSRSKRERRRPT